MPDRAVAFGGVRDVLLVVVTVATAFGLGAASAHIGGGVASVRPAPSLTLGPASGDDAGRDFMRVRYAAQRATAANPERSAGASVAALRTARQAAANQQRADTARIRFFGDGGGRKETSGGRDPYDRRSFILETASLMHRRGWIGLSTRAGAEPVDVGRYPRSARVAAGRDQTGGPAMLASSHHPPVCRGDARIAGDPWDHTVIPGRRSSACGRWARRAAPLHPGAA